MTAPRPSILDWIEFLPRGIRSAWCELTGGHDNVVCGCWQGEPRATQISLSCKRCEKETRWYQVPLKTAEPGADVTNGMLGSSISGPENGK